MAAPTTPALDYFTRANSTGLGANWSELINPGEPLPNIVSNKANNTGSGGTVSSAYWNPSTFASDTEAWWIGSGGGAGGMDEMDVWVRANSIQGSGNLLPFAGYVLNSNGSGGTITLLKANGTGGVTTIGTPVTGVTTVLGLWLRIVGTTIMAYTWDGAAWNLQITVTDTTFTAAGYVGMEFGSGAASFVSRFGGGVVRPAFPTTPVLDNFNRGNESPLSGGGNWAQSTIDVGPLNLVSNAVQDGNSSNVATALWQPSTFRDVEAYCDVPVFPGANAVQLFARVDDLAEDNCYFLRVTRDGPPSIWDFRKRIAGASSVSIATSTAQNVANGDSIGFSVIGSTLIAYYKPSGGAWVPVFTATDTSLNIAGMIGPSIQFSTAAQVDNFGGGLANSHVVQAQASTPGNSAEAFLKAVTAGNMLVCVIRAGAVSSTLGVSDNVNGAWIQAAKQENAADGHSTAIFYLPNTLAGTPTVSCTSSGGGTIRFILAEYPIASPSLIAVNSAPYTTPGVWDSGTIAVNAGDLVIGAGSTDGNATGFWVPATNGGPWTVESDWIQTGQSRAVLQDVIPGSGGSFSFNSDTTTPSFTNGTSIVAAFRSVPVVAGPGIATGTFDPELKKEEWF